MAWWRKPSAQTPRSRWNQDDYHTAFAATSKAQIEQGVAPWQTPWTPGARRRPENLQTGTPYRDGNAVYLSVTQTAKGYRDHRWATYKQLHDRGGQVRTGEHERRGYDRTVGLSAVVWKPAVSVRYEPQPEANAKLNASDTHRGLAAIQGEFVRPGRILNEAAES